MSPDTGPDDAPTASDFIRDLIRQDIADGTHAGAVQTRFPPEPNGYLHIGHSKSIILNFGLAEEFGGSCNLRFDDTNPVNEEQEFVDAIQEDIAWLGYAPAKVCHASDYFDQLYAWAEELTGKGLAYVDDQDAETISEQRGGFGKPGVESPFRDRSPEENLRLLRGMRDGEFADGEKVLRAKVDMQHKVMTMRDPVLYRIRREEHQRTGDAWVIYPTYDWAHGQSDAIEGVTHSLCTLEFADHRPLYDWCLSHLELPTWAPQQTEFARLALTHTVMSKRVLRTLVEEGVVDGWDDPRMPTLRGLRKRGYPAEAIRQFVEHVGVARTNSTIEVELLESFVRKHHNTHALRRMAVLKPLRVVIDNWTPEQTWTQELPNNPESEDAGDRTLPITGEIWIDQDDFAQDPPPKYFRLSPGRSVRLRGGLYLSCAEDAQVDVDEDGVPTTIHATVHDEVEGKVKATITWVPAEHAVDAEVRLYDRLFTDEHPGAGDADPLESLNPASVEVITAKVEPLVADTPAGEVIQFERLGYFAADPDQPLVFHRVVGLRDEWANIQKRKAQGGGKGKGGQRQRGQRQKGQGQKGQKGQKGQAST